MSLTALQLRSLLVALVKRDFYGEQGFGNEVLVEQLFSGDADKQAAEAEIQGFVDLVEAAAAGYWDTTRLLKRLENSQLSADHLKVIAAFWANEREKIHEVLVRRSAWNGHFSKLSWRVDVKTVGKSSAELNEPVALLELRTDNGHNPSSAACEASSKKQTQFELNRTEIQELLAVFSSIGASLESAAY